MHTVRTYLQSSSKYEIENVNSNPEQCFDSGRCLEIGAGMRLFYRILTFLVRDFYAEIRYFGVSLH